MKWPLEVVLAIKIERKHFLCNLHKSIFLKIGEKLHVGRYTLHNFASDIFLYLFKY